MTVPSSSASDELPRLSTLAQALQAGRVIPVLGHAADDRLEALAVDLMIAFDLRLALLIGPHPQVEEALRQSGRPVHTVPPAAFGEPDPDTFHLVTLDADEAFEDRQTISGPPVSEALLAVLRAHSGLVLGMEPGDPWLEALAALWPERRFPQPWFILTPHPRPEAAAWEAYNLFPGLRMWSPLTEEAVKGIRDEPEATLRHLWHRWFGHVRARPLMAEPPLETAEPPQAFASEDESEQSRLRPQTLRIDAAAPAEVVVGDPFVLAVSVRQPDSPPLREEDLNLLKSGEAQVVFPETGPIKLRLRVSAPECTFDGPNEVAFRLFPGTDSPVFYFHLISRSTGLISIVVQLFQEDEWLGGLRLQTRAGSVPAGTVTMTVISQPLAPPAPDLKEQVQTLENRLQKARRFLALLEEQAVVMPPGAERAALQLQIEETKAEIAAIERELDRLLTPVV